MASGRRRPLAALALFGALGAALVVVPGPAGATDAAGLSVLVTDLAGAPLPGVTVEAGADIATTDRAGRGITRGCGPDRYCPHDWLTRAQMASLLARALGLPHVGGDTFRDDDGSTHEADIERIAAPRITRGCGPERFSPLEPVTRGQMAAFLHRALGA